VESPGVSKVSLDWPIFLRFAKFVERGQFDAKILSNQVISCDLSDSQHTDLGFLRAGESEVILKSTE